MTRRERKEARAERLREWASKREAKADGCEAQNAPFRGDWAFSTQPGHIPERARAIKRQERAGEHRRKAGAMRSRAAGIEQQLDRSIYSDDDNAIEALEARISEREKKRATMKARNAAFRKAKGNPEKLAALLDWSVEQAGRLIDAVNAQETWLKPVPHQPYELSNLGAKITADRKRIEAIKAHHQRTEAAEASGGVTIEGDTHVRVTFAEKPERDMINALKVAGFRWSGGSWWGRRDAIPEGVTT